MGLAGASGRGSLRDSLSGEKPRKALEVESIPAVAGIDLPEGGTLPPTSRCRPVTEDLSVRSCQAQEGSR